MNREVKIDIYTLLILCIKQRNNENLLHSSGNPAQYSGDLKGKEIGKHGVYVYV